MRLTAASQWEKGLYDSSCGLSGFSLYMLRFGATLAAINLSGPEFIDKFSKDS